MAVNRLKYGYLSYEDMLVRLNEGKLDAYDLVFEKNTKECFVITPELIPSPIVSRVRVFNSVSEANEALNTSIDTYAGQIVSVIVKGVHKGYIVNKNNDVFEAVPLSSFDGEIDYNTIGNKPIVNLVGTLDSPIVLSTIENGVYSVKGQYKIAPNDTTVFLNSTANICMVEHTEGGKIHVKRVSTSEIKDYEVVDDVVTSYAYVTEKHLAEHGYATIEYVKEYVDSKFAEVNFVTEEVVETLIDEKVSTVMAESVETLVETKIDEKIQETSEDDITALFQ